MQTELIMRINKIAQAQHGHVHLDQMLSEGASEGWIRRNTGAWLQRVDRCEFRIGPRTLNGDRRVALDIGGPGAMLLGFHGLDVWNMPRAGRSLDTIDVWCSKQRQPRPGVHFSRAAWVELSDVRRVNGLEVARRAVCVASVASALEPVDLVKLIREAHFWERDAFDQLCRLVREHRRFRGRTGLITALQWYAAGHCGLDSASEKFVLAGLRRLGVRMPILNAVLMLQDGELRPDFYWDRAGLLLENNPVGHQREWVRQADLGRIARAQRDRLDVISLDRTAPIDEQRRVLLAVAQRVVGRDAAPVVQHVVRPIVIV